MSKITSRSPPSGDSIRPADWDHYPLRVTDNTRRILDWLDGYGLRATFFVLGWVAQRVPGLVREIAARGHEIACHGFGHQLLFDIGPERFRADIRAAKALLEDICAAAVNGYRAPSYSITRRSLWALEILVEEGFIYDSSIYPIWHDLYGMPDGRRFPHTIRCPAGDLREFPITTFALPGTDGRLRLPVGGGGYLRLLPAALIAHAFRHINEREGQPALLYFHPWEIDPGQPRVRAGFKSRFRHYHHLEKTFAKLDYLLSRLRFAPLRDVFAAFDWQKAAIDGVADVGHRALLDTGRTPAGAEPTGFSMNKLLIVEDDLHIQKQMKWGLGKEYRVLPAARVKEALLQLRQHQPPIVTLDLGLPPDPGGTQEGFRCLESILAERPLTKVIVLTGNHDRQNALRAVQMGAYDFLQKPIDLHQLKIILSRAVHVAALEEENHRLQRSIEAQAPGLSGIFGQCPQMQEIFRLIGKVASCDVPVLVLGESGTGKELVARAIHEKSLRKGGPFIPINCGAIPENLLESELFGHEKGAFTGAQIRVQGKVEYAHRGTLFLDEIGELSPAFAGEAAAFSAGKSPPAGRRPRGHRGRCPHHRRHQRRYRQGDRSGELPRRSLLPHQRRHHGHAAAARKG